MSYVIPDITVTTLLDDGWLRLVDKYAGGFTSWEDELTDYDPESCVFLTGQSEWYDIPCVSSALGLTARCLCTGPATASSTFSDDLEALEAALKAAVEEHLQKIRVNVAVAYPIATLIALLPALLLLGRRALLRLRSGGAAAGEGDGAPPSPPPRTALAPTASPRRATQGAARPTRPPRRRQASSARRAARPRSGGCM